MATPKFVNRARMLTSTTGTGTSVALTTAVGGYFTLAEAGLQDAMCHVIDVIEVNGTGYKNILSISSTGFGGVAIFGCARKTTNAINAVRIFPGTGALTCKWSLYGYK